MAGLSSCGSPAEPSPTVAASAAGPSPSGRSDCPPPPDIAAALEWFRRAAAQGYVDAQYNLGVMYDNAQG
ncbi:MAG: sel1 repeat family protein, partial [Planctomycetes bacterium]|nr:sel1 repeat family protein [Planctomycetota bacterium]